MQAQRLDAALRQLIPSAVNMFQKLTAGDPYRFESWSIDRYGAACMYYWFKSKDESRENHKRTPVSELRTALQHLQATGTLDRTAFKTNCPVSQSAGPCGFAVAGRILEALGVARYSGRDGFILIDARKAESFL
jgi:hypothetical protein